MNEIHKPIYTHAFVEPYVKECVRLKAQNADLLATLQSILDWQDCPATRPEAKELLIRNAAIYALRYANTNKL